MAVFLPYFVCSGKQGNQKNCNVIRGEIGRFLAKGTMTQTAFLKEIGCNSNSYGRFMKLKVARQPARTIVPLMRGVLHQIGGWSTLN